MTQHQTKVIETERLLLRHLTLADLDDLFAFYQAARVRQTIPDAPQSYMETKAELLAIRADYGRYGFGLWATIYRESGAFIGRCGLIPCTIERQEEAEVACALSPAYWGKGLATEAARAIVQYGLKHLYLPRLICRVRQQNQAYVRVAQKIGMTLVGELFIDDLTVLCYAISRLKEQ